MFIECKQFAIEVEEYLDHHPGRVAFAPPPGLAGHIASCRTCAQRWHKAAASRVLLAKLQAAAGEGDPFFYTRLEARLQESRVRSRVGARAMALAAALFFATLGSFVYNLHRIETPNADEAMVLDVPHLNPYHPSDDHVRPQYADAMLNLMNP